jgi:ATP-dependent RNA helicase RhlE
MTFEKLGLAEPILRAVADEGYAAPSPVQTAAIPHVLQGRDVMACAQTGTGKTGAFALPVLHRLAAADASRKGGRLPRALVLCPTRELAAQIFESFVRYGRRLSLRHAVIFGGVNQNPQVRALRAGADTIIATPGRLMDLMNQGHVDLSAVETLVLDEADRMLDMGFIHDIRKIVARIPASRQSLLFSATVSPEIRRLAGSILRDPAVVETARESTTAEAVDQRVYLVERPNKPDLLETLLQEVGVGRSLVFSRTKHGADKIVRRLRQASIDAEAIHGNKTQNARTRAMKSFRSGRTRVLVATDIASRGIDVDEITHVFNYDMPADAETYVHRIGRTARAGASGVAVSFCGSDERKLLRQIERRTDARISVTSAGGSARPSRAPEDRDPGKPAARKPARKPRSRSTPAPSDAPAGKKPRTRKPKRRTSGASPTGGAHSSRPRRPRTGKGVKVAKRR